MALPRLKGLPKLNTVAASAAIKSRDASSAKTGPHEENVAGTLMSMARSLDVSQMYELNMWPDLLSH